MSIAIGWRCVWEQGSSNTLEVGMPLRNRRCQGWQNSSVFVSPCGRRWHDRRELNCERDGQKHSLRALCTVMSRTRLGGHVLPQQGEGPRNREGKQGLISSRTLIGMPCLDVTLRMTYLKSHRQPSSEPVLQRCSQSKIASHCNSTIAS
jgi:hypothetical protein